MIDSVEVKQVQNLSRRDIEHDNPEFRRIDEMVHFLEQIYGRKIEMDDTVTVVHFSQISDRPSEIRERCARTRRRRTEGSAPAPATGCHAIRFAPEPFRFPACEAPWRLGTPLLECQPSALWL